MHDRSALGPADVSDEQLTSMVADLLGSDVATTRLLDSRADEFPYDLPAITTAGRYWVSGTALADDTERPWRMFVKHIQAWSRSPLFAEVPPEHREMAEASVPWRTEALAYRSDLRDRLPQGLCMARALGVFDLDEKSAAVWLEEVRPDLTPWDLRTYARAAHLLGRLAASDRVAALADVGRHDFDIRTYRDGRLALQVLPMLRDEGIWCHPLVADAFDDETRLRLLAAADWADDLVEEILALPRATSHGDACPNNLLRTEGWDGFVLIDFGFWGGEPVGFDLAQLLVGDVQVGRRTGDDLQAVEETILPAYVDGLRAEGCDVTESVVRRSHALQLMIFTGFSCLPWEHLGSELTPELRHVAEQRAAIARFSLDLLDATEPVAAS
jgi:hypothetical protein